MSIESNRIQLLHEFQEHNVYNFKLIKIDVKSVHVVAAQFINLADVLDPSAIPLLAIEFLLNNYSYNIITDGHAYRQMTKDGESWYLYGSRFNAPPKRLIANWIKEYANRV